VSAAAGARGDAVAEYDRSAAVPPAQPPTPSFEDYPLTRQEYIAAVVHFYRGELAHADAWRARLDPTTNWAVVTTGGMLSFAFSNPSHSHVTLLLADLLVIIFLSFEARRFRYYDVWRSRVRMIEENFFIPILLRNLVSPRARWSEWVAQDLDRPKFKKTFLEAVGVRLRYNYIWIFLVILVAWIAKLNVHPTAAWSPMVVLRRAAIGPVPGALILGMVAAFYALAIWLALRAGRERGVIDEVHGLETSIDHWKM
jgi:uncharacterized membrane protein